LSKQFHRVSEEKKNKDLLKIEGNDTILKKVPCTTQVVAIFTVTERLQHRANATTPKHGQNHYKTKQRFVTYVADLSACSSSTSSNVPELPLPSDEQ